MQNTNNLDKNFTLLPELASAHCELHQRLPLGAPVSYTHLDVYKRQAPTVSFAEIDQHM